MENREIYDMGYYVLVMVRSGGGGGRWGLPEEKDMFGGKI